VWAGSQESEVKELGGPREKTCKTTFTGIRGGGDEAALKKWGFTPVKRLFNRAGLPLYGRGRVQAKKKTKPKKELEFT